LSGTAFDSPRSTGAAAALWLDKEGGHIVDATLPLPNHAEYRDFRLKLLKASDGGAAEWTALLTRHHETCAE
jgi:hypothetical protein